MSVGTQGLNPINVSVGTLAVSQIKCVCGNAWSYYNKTCLWERLDLVK